MFIWFCPCALILQLMLGPVPKRGTEEQKEERFNFSLLVFFVSS